MEGNNKEFSDTHAGMGEVEIHSHATHDETPSPSSSSPQPTERDRNDGGASANAAAATPSSSKPASSYDWYTKKKATFYSSKDGAFERAMEDVKREVYNQQIDGELLGAWLLVEVDHWDNETEKIVVLTDENIMSVRYDFVPMKVHKYKRQALKSIDTLQIGDFKYPEMSLINKSSDMRRRNCGGARLMWNKGEEPGFFQKWKPSSDAMPWMTFTYHPLIYSQENQDQADTGSSARYSVEDFSQHFIQAVNKAYEKCNPGQMLVVKEEPLEQKVYVGLPSQIHNQSFLGMSKERGGLSF